MTNKIFKELSVNSVILTYLGMYFFAMLLEYHTANFIFIIEWFPMR